MAAIVAGNHVINTTTGTKTTAAFTPALGDLLILITFHTANTSATAPTDDNADGLGAYTQITGCLAQKNTSADTMRFWIRNALVGSATSTTATHAPGTTTGGGVVAMRVSGMTKTGATAALVTGAQQNQAGGGTPTVTLSGTPTGTNPMVGAVFNQSVPPILTEPSGWTENNDIGYSTPTTGLEVVRDDTGFASGTVTWGSASGSGFCSFAVELDASGNGVVSPPPPVIKTFAVNRANRY
jgi:hypothetical protein